MAHIQCAGPTSPKATGIRNLRAVQLLLGPTSTDSTVRFPAVDPDDALWLMEGTDR
jgi:hypothetical protein